MTRAIQAELSGLSNTNNYTSISNQSEFEAYGRTGITLVRAIEALELAKVVLESPAMARYGSVVDKAKEELAVAEALFTAQVTLKESTREQTASARQRLFKAKSDLDEVNAIVTRVVTDGNEGLLSAIAQATATYAKGVWL